jgi:hypothetical protein
MSMRGLPAAGVLAASILIAGCTNADSWHVVASVNFHAVAHIEAPSSIRKACRSFRTQVVPDAQLQGQSGFAGMEPDFVRLIGHGWDASGYPPVVECDFTARRTHAARQPLVRTACSVAR